MRSDSREMWLNNSVNDKCNAGDLPAPSTSHEVQAGIEDSMSHAERQDYLMRSELGQQLGVSEQIKTTASNVTD